MDLDINKYIGKTFLSPYKLQLYIFHIWTDPRKTAGGSYKHTLYAYANNGSIYKDFISDTRLKGFKRTKTLDDNGRRLAIKRLFNVIFIENYEKDKNRAFSEKFAINSMIKQMRGN